jgi:hypothetical protein
VAGAAIPRASNPTVPNKNFFITQSPFVMRFVERTMPARAAIESGGHHRRDSSRRLYPKYNTRTLNERRSKLMICLPLFGTEPVRAANGASEQEQLDRWSRLSLTESVLPIPVFTFALCCSECVSKKCGPTSFPHWMFGRTARTR